MNKTLSKAYDIIKEEQRNADNKANLFIVLLAAFLSFFQRIPVNSYSPDQIEGLGFVYVIAIVALLFLVMSLIPMYKHTYGRFKKKKDDIDFNIFYWGSISNLTDDNELYGEYKKRYNENKELIQTEKDILSQIRVNSEIIERKIYFHKGAFIIIGQLVLVFMISIITYFTFRDSILAFGIYFFLFEFIFIVSLINRPKFIFDLLQKT